MAWGRTAARPGRLVIAQLERTRGMLEGKLAEYKVQLQNTQLAHDSMQAERDRLLHKLTVDNAAIRRAMQSKGGIKDRLRPLPRALRGSAEQAAMAPDGDDEAASVDASAAAVASELSERVKALEEEKAALQASVGEAQRYYHGHAARTVQAERMRAEQQATVSRYDAELLRYQIEKLTHGYAVDRLTDATAHDVAAAAAVASRGPTIFEGAAMHVAGGAWTGGELSQPVDGPPMAMRPPHVAPQSKVAQRLVGGRHTSVRMQSGCMS